jgi:hypothetical protein
VTPPRIRARTLYLLALFQLVAGPLVLVTVFLFAKVTVREAPSQGLVKALSSAWQSHEVQSALHAASEDTRDPAKSAPTKATKDKAKLIGIAWSGVDLPSDSAAKASVSTRLETWTPAWPQAPPGTPPRAV